MSCTSYDILGQQVDVRTTCSQFAGRLAGLLRSFPVCEDNGRLPDVTLSLVVAPPAKTSTMRPFHFLYMDGYQVGRTHHEWQLFRFLECELDHMLADHVTSHLLLHSGSVAKDGAGIVIPGESGSGKSSLTLALLESGYEYFSDEIAVVDSQSGELRSFPKPVSIKNRSNFPNLFGPENLWFGPESDVQDSVWYVHPEDLGAVVADKPVPIRYIIFPTRCAPSDAALRPLTAGQALTQLVANSINLPNLGSKGFHLIAELVNQAQSFSLKSADLAASVSLVNGLLENRD
ncbi:MAG: hypothetical protein IIB31_09005 [Chloroflexi bacterium]|nr:hypothetical protein [Chloroflexota bacterium]